MPESIFKKIADDAPALIWIADKKGTFTFFNKSWLKFTGNTQAKEVAGKGELGIHPEDLTKVKRRFQQAYKTKKPYKIEYRLRSRKGAYHWVLESGSPQFDKKNQFNGYKGICTDINELKVLEGKKNDFIVAASHELKTPLTSLKVYLQLIDHYFTTRKIVKYGGFSTAAVKQLEKINELVDQLLDINKLDEGSLTYHFQTFPVKDIVTRVIDRVKLAYPRRTIEFNYDSHGVIRGDEERLSQAVESLLINALKFSKEEDKVIVKMSQDSTYLNLDIIDFGIGISKDFHTKIFEKFFRIPGEMESTYPGLGMGLYIANKIVSKHKGKIKVESREREFTKFSIQIPLPKKSTLSRNG